MVSKWKRQERIIGDKPEDSLVKTEKFATLSRNVSRVQESYHDTQIKSIRCTFAVIRRMIKCTRLQCNCLHCKYCKLYRMGRL